jgi:ABC-type glutathione transport system ATPase component
MLLTVKNLSKEYNTASFLGRKARKTQALCHANFSIGSGEILGVVGESGSGKSTLGRIIAGLVEPTAGELVFGPTVNDRCRDVQFIPQDPFDSFDPLMTIGASLLEPLLLYGDRPCARDTMTRSLELVGLSTNILNRRPHEFSGGQRQRLAIARALSLDPKLLICDEPTASLDVSLQSQILNLLWDLQERLGIGMIFISHDLEIIKNISHRILVVHSGIIVEQGDTQTVMRCPTHPYTRHLIDIYHAPATDRR